MAEPDDLPVGKAGPSAGHVTELTGKVLVNDQDVHGSSTCLQSRIKMQSGVQHLSNRAVAAFSSPHLCRYAHHS